MQSRRRFDVLSTARRVVFLDRDGVINRLRPDHVKCWAEFEFLPGALEAIGLLTRAQSRIIVITNQSAVGRGLMTADALQEIHSRMCEVVSSRYGCIEGVYACPHAPDAKCSCRKPQAELFIRAAAELGLELPGSVMVGDTDVDVEAALAAGCMPIRVSNVSSSSEHDDMPVVHDLLSAAQVIEQMSAFRTAPRC